MTASEENGFPFIPFSPRHLKKTMKTYKQMISHLSTIEKPMWEENPYLERHDDLNDRLFDADFAKTALGRKERAKVFLKFELECTGNFSTCKCFNCEMAREEAIAGII